MASGARKQWHLACISSNMTSDSFHFSFSLTFSLIFIVCWWQVRALKCAVCLPARHEEGGAALAQELREQVPGLTLSACPHAEDHSPPTHGPTEVRACPLGSRGCHQQRSGEPFSPVYG